MSAPRGGNIKWREWVPGDRTVAVAKHSWAETTIFFGDVQRFNASVVDRLQTKSGSNKDEQSQSPLIDLKAAYYKAKSQTVQTQPVLNYTVLWMIFETVVTGGNASSPSSSLFVIWDL